MINKIPIHQRVRFKDCDPMGHLYNSRYIDYLLEAREQQLYEQYQFDLFDYLQNHQKAWVIIKHEILYLKEALVNEHINLDSDLLEFDSRKLTVEYKMWDSSCTRLKAIMWTQFFHIDLTIKKSVDHDSNLMLLLQQMHHPIEEKNLQERVLRLSGSPNKIKEEE